VRGTELALVFEVNSMRKARGARTIVRNSRWSAGALLASGFACSGPTPVPESVTDLRAFIPPNACTDEAPTAEFTCRQQAAWGKCGEGWMRKACDDSCGRCFRGASSCGAALRGEAIPVRLRFDGRVSIFGETFELFSGNPNHPDRDAVHVGREDGAAGASSGRYVLRATSTTTYGVDIRTVSLDLETGVLTKSTVMSGRDLGTTRVAFPADGGNREEYAEHLRALREIVARVQAGHVWREVGFDTGPRAELIDALCYLEALSVAVAARP